MPVDKLLVGKAALERNLLEKRLEPVRTNQPTCEEQSRGEYEVSLYSEVAHR